MEKYSDDILIGDRYDGFDHVLDATTEGDVLFVEYFGKTQQRQHTVVENVTEDAVEVRSRTGQSLTVDRNRPVIVVTRGFGTEGREMYRVERIPQEIAEKDNWHKWEVHLVVDGGYESSDDEVLFPEATSREQAIGFARRRSDSNPPRVGPVYDEGPVTTSSDE